MFSDKTDRAKILLYIRELRAPFLTASVMPMILGLALAYSHDNTADIPLMILTLLSGALIHLGSNTLNDYFDLKQCTDGPEVLRTPFSGGSGLLSGGFLSPKEVMNLSLFLLTAATVAGAVILFLSPGNAVIILLFGVTGIFLGYAYTAPPLKLSYRGLGEIAVFLSFGPLPVTASYYVVAGEISITPFIISLPLGIMTSAILWINQFPDYLTDKKAGKNTLLVRIGVRRGRYVYYSLIVMVIITLAAGVYYQIIPVESLWGLFFLIPVIPACYILHNSYETPQKLIPAMALTIAAHLLLSVLMVAGTLL